VRSCRAASVVATGALLALGAMASCRETARLDVPPVTTARPDGGDVPGARVAAVGDAGTGTGPAADAPVNARFVDTPARLDAAACQRVLVAVAKGKVTALGETLSAGDVLVVAHGEPFEAKGAGSVVWAQVALAGECKPATHPPLAKTVIRATSAPELRWAGGAMTAHLDVAPNPPKADGAATRPPSSPSPELYLGRLEGSAPVGEHSHAASWEILAAAEASGAFVLEGVEGRLGPRQIVVVPPGARHAWRPDPGSKLVAIQMYSPPGPEQRFVGLAAAERDAGAAADAGARDAKAP
jgi:mannose-6-phosphate isomerase-like protein (cupin superfamily)